MNRPLVVLLPSTAALVLLCCILYATVSSPKSFAQGNRKSLDIARYSEEPLELKELKVGQQSLKAKIKTKFRQPENTSRGFDTVEFEDTDDWYKQIAASLRNKSGKRITGLTAYLYFRPPNAQRMFSVTLTGSSGQLERTVLEPGDEVQIEVDGADLDQAIMRLRAYGGDPADATVSFSVEMVAFDDGRMWNRGHMVEKDPKNPLKWVPVPTKSPPGLSRLSP